MPADIPRALTRANTCPEMQTGPEQTAAPAQALTTSNPLIRARRRKDRNGETWPAYRPPA